MTLFWDRAGEPIEDTLEWARLFEDTNYRIVAVDQDAPGTPMVSTIWQGLDLAHSLHPDAVPMLFETVYMTGGSDGDGRVEERWFSATESEAFGTHASICQQYLGREALPDGGLKAEILRREAI